MPVAGEKCSTIGVENGARTEVEGALIRVRAFISSRLQSGHYDVRRHESRKAPAVLFACHVGSILCGCRYPQA